MKSVSWTPRLPVLSVVLLALLQPCCTGAYLRHLQEIPTATSSVPLFLAISFVDEATASRLESRDHQDEVVTIFCGAVHEQVSTVAVNERYLEQIFNF